MRPWPETAGQRALVATYLVQDCEQDPFELCCIFSHGVSFELQNGQLVTDCMSVGIPASMANQVGYMPAQRTRMLMLLIILGDPSTHAENVHRIECDVNWPKQLAWMRSVVVARTCPPPLFATLQKCILRPDLIDFIRDVGALFMCKYENPADAASLIEAHMASTMHVRTAEDHDWMFAACSEAEIAVFPASRKCPNTVSYCLGGVRIAKLNHALILLMGMHWGDTRPACVAPLITALTKCQRPTTWVEIGNMLHSAR